MSNQPTQPWNTLKQTIFDSYWVRLGVGVLLFSFILQPISLAYAEEVSESAASIEESVPDPVTVDSIDEVAEEPEPESPELIEEVPPEVFLDEAEVSDSIVQTQSTTNSDETVEPVSTGTPPITTAEVVVEPIIPMASSTVSNPNTTALASSTLKDGIIEGVSLSTTTTTTNPPATTTEAVLGTSILSTQATNTVNVEITKKSTTTETKVLTPEKVTPIVKKDQPGLVETSLDEAEDQNGATSSMAIPEPITLESGVDGINKFKFSNKQCVSVGDGAYYCHTDIGNPVQTVDRIYSATDADGDMEIFLAINGEKQQITNNLLDDAAPEYDASSKNIVWHRMVNGRYQIMLKGLQSDEEIQLTNGRHNSMEPAIEGGVIVWQQWDGNDWEIALFNGETTILITDNDTPDISPVINDGYVLWTTHGSDGNQIAKLYDIKTQETRIISHTEGGAIINPRFVLVYDTKFDNGDLITQGYDMKSGAVIPLAAAAGELPNELPDPESTGETKALIQQKTTTGQKEKPVSNSDGNADVDRTVSATTSTPLGTGPTATIHELDLQATSTKNFELDEFDIIVPATKATSSAISATSTGTINAEQ